MDTRIWKRFLEPMTPVLISIAFLWALFAVPAGIARFFKLGWFGKQESINLAAHYGLVLPGQIVVVAAVIYGIWWAVRQLRAHYKKCEEEIYKEDHNIPRHCRRSLDHRLYHVVGRDCPCRK